MNLLTADEVAEVLRRTRSASYAMVERSQLPNVTQISRRSLSAPMGGIDGVANLMLVAGDIAPTEAYTFTIALAERGINVVVRDKRVSAPTQKLRHVRRVSLPLQDADPIGVARYCPRAEGRARRGGPGVYVADVCSRPMKSPNCSAQRARRFTRWLSAAFRRERHEHDRQGIR